MTKADGGAPAPLSLSELRDARTDYVDVAVPTLGGKVLRLWALSGTARAELLPEMIDLSSIDDLKADRDPAVMRRVFDFQNKVVGCALGFPPEEWAAVGAILGTDAIDLLYAAAAKLSGIAPDSEAEATERLPATRSADSGTD